MKRSIVKTIEIVPGFIIKVYQVFQRTGYQRRIIIIKLAIPDKRR
jgi:hypothetical protein